jgi:hypothetical protein
MFRYGAAGPDNACRLTGAGARGSRNRRRARAPMSDISDVLESAKIANSSFEREVDFASR